MRIFLPFVFFTFSYLFSYGQLFPHLTFQRFYDNVGEDTPTRIVKAVDGTIFIGGNTLMPDSIVSQCGNMWIIKVDTLGETIWEQEVAISGCESLRDMVATQDGGVMFTGVTNSLIPHRERGDATYWGDFFVGKMDSIGTIEWLQSYGGSSHDQAFAIQEGPYREFMITGSSHSADGEVKENHGMSDIWALKIDTKGQYRMGTVFGGKKSDWAIAITQCINGDYLLAGYSNSEELGEESLGWFGNGLLVRMTQSGHVAWSRTFPCPSGGYFTNVIEEPDGRIIVTGNHSTDKGGDDFWWLKLTAYGKKISEKIWVGPDDEHLIATEKCMNGGYLLGGYSIPKTGGGKYAKGGEDFWLVRTDERGEVIWRNTYGGPDHERCTGILEYRPGVFYAIGEKKDNFSPDQTKDPDKDFWLLRIDEYPTDSILAGIFVRAKDFRINRETPTRFRARYRYGERFLWDFGDGTTSTEEMPLKTYEISGVYEVQLTIYVNENCQETIYLDQELEVW